MRRRPAAARDRLFHGDIRGGFNDQTIIRYGTHQVMELRLYRLEIGKDISVIEFDIVNHQGARVIVNKLGALVEKRRIVLVGLDHKER